MTSGVHLKEQKIIEVKYGDVLHALKRTDPEFSEFGEAYFSTVHNQSIKAWKRHREATLNIVVPVGRIRFVIYDDRKSSEGLGQFQEEYLSRENYKRLTLPPMVWLGFQGAGDGENVLLNLSSLVHDPSESDRLDIDEIEFDWRKAK